MTRQPIHARSSGVTGSGSLNSKALKVLAAIKFAPTSLSREDIADKTSLPVIDVQRQVKLLLGLGLVSLHSQFPVFPSQGWKVFTKQQDHIRITNLLSQHNIHDPRVEQTRELLGGYYPTGLDLEGSGTQPDRGNSYTQGHPIIPELDFKPEAMAVMIKFRDEKKPFRPKAFSEEAVTAKKEKWKWLVKELSKVYNIQTPLVQFGAFTQDSWARPGSSGNDDHGQSSYYNRGTNTLYFIGRFSLTTLLHEFGHARGFDERDTIIWSLNFGMRVFPVTFNRLLGSSEDGTHMLTMPNESDVQYNL